MNSGVEILLARMETHPEEFFRDSRWRHIIADFSHDLETEDFKALDEGLRKCRQSEFTGIVFQRLVNEEAEEKKLMKNYSNPMMFHGFTQLDSDEDDMKEDGLNDAQIAVIRNMKGKK